MSDASGPAFAGPEVRSGTWEAAQRLVDEHPFMDNVRMLFIKRDEMASMAVVLPEAARAFDLDEWREPSVLIVDCAGDGALAADLDAAAQARRLVDDPPSVFFVSGHDGGRVRTPRAPRRWYWAPGAQPARSCIVEDDTGVYGTYGLAPAGGTSASRFLDSVGALPSEADVFADGDRADRIDADSWPTFLDVLSSLGSRRVSMMVPAPDANLAYAGVRCLPDGSMLLEATPSNRGPAWAHRFVDEFGCSSAVAAYVDPPETTLDYRHLANSEHVAWVVDAPVASRPTH